MKRQGLSRKDAIRFRIGISPDNVPPPHNTKRAAWELMQRGYAATESKLKKFVERGKLPPSDSIRSEAAWNEDRMEQAADLFEEAGDFTPEGLFFRDYGLTLTEVYKALDSAYRSAVDEFGSAAYDVLAQKADSYDFRMILDPGWDRRKARIKFEVLPEVRKKMEKLAAKR